MSFDCKKNPNLPRAKLIQNQETDKLNSIPIEMLGICIYINI